jgi:hypothetical protein
MRPSEGSKTMRKFIFAAVVVMAPVTADAASTLLPNLHEPKVLNYPSAFTGKWCLVDDPDSDPDSNWQYFRRGKCDDQQYIILYKNGDYMQVGAHTYR